MMFIVYMMNSTTMSNLNTNIIYAKVTGISGNSLFDIQFTNGQTQKGRILNSLSSMKKTKKRQQRDRLICGSWVKVQETEYRMNKSGSSWIIYEKLTEKETNNLTSILDTKTSNKETQSYLNTIVRFENDREKVSANSDDIDIDAI